jgi:hypothetical protein
MRYQKLGMKAKPQRMPCWRSSGRVLRKTKSTMRSERCMQQEARSRSSMINSSKIILCRRFKPAVTVSPLTGLNVATSIFRQSASALDAESTRPCRRNSVKRVCRSRSNRKSELPVSVRSTVRVVVKRLPCRNFELRVGLLHGNFRGL